MHFWDFYSRSQAFFCLLLQDAILLGDRRWIHIKFMTNMLPYISTITYFKTSSLTQAPHNIFTRQMELPLHGVKHIDIHNTFSTQGLKVSFLLSCCCISTLTCWTVQWCSQFLFLFFVFLISSETLLIFLIIVLL